MPQQMPEFRVGEETISIRPDVGERLAQALWKRSPGGSAARKIERATELTEDPTVELAIGEDEAVLEALDVLRVEGHFSMALERLDRALRKRISAEP